uniref:Histone acetyltransferase n=1 Tax=Tanacetum cinerariifolium TaxID=118510 RepID=A0A699KDH3_TANCI|nr:histone acetyltransferase [Tanacetum cinerariifolium]
MPRPGPRPFECVKRSWHSDRHQPIRGSIIQQIFRLVHENHTSGTKQNREWQEKLPVVVLKSEEIMYSKANSEAEYLDPDTLWDRLNDAVDTIIRKDETLETGALLPPCVEAALNLGCVPVKSSRSQRNTNTRSYLSPRNQDSGPDAPTHNVPNAQRPDGGDRTHIVSETSNHIRPSFRASEFKGKKENSLLLGPESTLSTKVDPFPLLELRPNLKDKSHSSISGRASIFETLSSLSNENNLSGLSGPL